MQKRKSIRLKDYDYLTPGAYFVTVCVHNKECILGNIKSGQISLSEIGEIANKYWIEIPLHFKNVKPDEYIIMPNHVHGIIILRPVVELNNGVEFFIGSHVNSVGVFDRTPLRVIKNIIREYRRREIRCP